MKPPPFIQLRKNRTNDRRSGQNDEAELLMSSDGLINECLQTTKSGRDLDVKAKVFYINLTITDASGAVYETVQTKLKNITKIPKAVTNAVAAKAAKSVPPKVVAKKLATKLPRILMYKLSEKGLTIHAETVFLEHNFLCVQLQVQHCNIALLVQSVEDDAAKSKQKAAGSESNQRNRDDDDDSESIPDDSSSVESAVLEAWIQEKERDYNEQAASPYVITSRLDAKISGSGPLQRKSCLSRLISWVLSTLLSTHYRQSIESTWLPSMIQATISAKMNEMLTKKMDDKLIEAQVAVLGEEDQSRYFFNHLKDVRSAMDGFSKQP